ncbi:DUF5050 domain-containing protein [Clostridium sp. MB40-C1]|uniref:DUF5050 domain-containing protein n=1 Tax=Clostridium sp. MB40-C1 TaxID=3070996 RepID=UPI0027DF49C2|nr:DUF5050 domain-containing protein [Clostridium sp. MB40-C1]WMJ82148.1 DUF5050 domain-containing protein [Clostridium sp. MB40-C1]
MKRQYRVRFGLLFLICSVFFSFQGFAYGQDSFQGNTNCNISNLGYISKEGDYIYYSNIAQGSKLYKAKSDGKEEKLIVEDIPNYINVVGDYIYYSNVKDGFKIYKVKKDGTERTALNKASSHWVKVIGEWIYYAKRDNKGQKLYKIKTDGSEETKVIEDRIFGFIIKDDWIFYSNESDKNKLYKIKLDGNEKTKLNDEESILIDIVDNNIYYQNHAKQDKIYKINTNGQNNLKINDDSISFGNISDNYIYYSNIKDNMKLYKIKLDGKDKIKLTDEGVGEMNVIGDYIYYWKATSDPSKGVSFDSTKLNRVKKDGSSKEVFKIGKDEKPKDEKMSTSSIIIVLLIVGTATFMEVWKLISTHKITKYVNNIQGEITNEDARKYISLIKRSRIVKRSDIYILLRKGVQAVNSSYKVDDELKKELDDTLLRRGINLNNGSKKQNKE